jgi:autotransporter-associated beta strand protein
MNTPHNQRINACRRLGAGLALASIAALAVPAAQAQTNYFWDGGDLSNNSWGAANNWDPNTVPTFNNQAVLNFNNTTRPTSVLGGADRTVRSIVFGADMDSSFSVGFWTSPNTVRNLTMDTDVVAGSASINVLSGATGNITLGVNAGSTVYGNLILADNLDVDHNGTGTLLINRPITGAFGITKSGSGTMVLSGTNTYTGNTTVSAGTLLINGSTAADSAVTVASGATLGGNGSIGGAVTVSGNLNPGTSPGDLTLNDALTLNSTATLTLEITGIGGAAFDRLIGDGANTFTFGGTLALDNTGYSATLGDTITVFSNWSALAGTFNSITGTDLGGGLSWDTTNLGVNGSLSVIPEPTTFVMLLGGMGAAALIRRRRSNR